MPLLERIQLDGKIVDREDFNRLQTAIERALHKIQTGVNSNSLTIDNFITGGSATPGPAGARGVDGRDGEDGDMGLQGFPGLAGLAGRVGRDGIDGQDGDDVSPAIPDGIGMSRAQFWISTPDVSAPNGVNMGALGTGPLQQTVTAGVAIPSVFAWPLANRVMTSSGTTTAPLGNAAFQFDVSGTRVLFMGAGSSQSWANVGNLGDANTDRITASWAANLWTLKSEATGTGTVRSMKIDAGTATLTLNASAGLTFTSTSISITSESGGTGHNLTINGNNSDSLLSSSQWDAVTFLTTHNSSIVANNTMTVTGSPTLASATSLVADAVKLSAGITLTGTTAVTTATGLNAVVVPRPGIVLGNAGSVTISFAASVYIANAPLAGTGIIITNGYALWVDAGSVRIDGSVALGGGAAATLGTIGGSGPTAAAQAKWIPLNSDGTQYFVAAWS